MTDTEMDLPPAADTWEGILATLRRRYPGQKDSVLFCIYKLQQNSDLSLRDFRAEAELHGIPMAGRSLHSARILLGLAKDESKPTGSRAGGERTRGESAGGERAAPESLDDRGQSLPRLARRRNPADDDGGVSIEAKVLAAVKQIQTAAGAETDQLRAAIQQAITILQRALGS